MAYRISTPKTPPPIKRLDSVNAKRLDVAADTFLHAPTGTKLEPHDRALMIGEIESRRDVHVAERSDDYIAQRYVCMRTDFGGGPDPLIPPDGMAANSTVAAEVKGNAKAERSKINAYLCRARTELANAYGSGITKQPNPGDVETRAYELAQTDPEGLFR